MEIKSVTDQMKLAQEEESRRLAEYRIRFGMRWDSREETRALEDHYRECRHIIRKWDKEEAEDLVRASYCGYGGLDDIEVDVDHWDMGD